METKAAGHFKTQTKTGTKKASVERERKERTAPPHAMPETAHTTATQTEKKLAAERTRGNQFPNPLLKGKRVEG